MEIAFLGPQRQPRVLGAGTVFDWTPGKKGHRGFLAFRPMSWESALESSVQPAEGDFEVPTPLIGRQH